MKKLFVFFLISFFCQLNFAQPPGDASREDYLRSILNADVLTGRTSATTIMPDVYDLCFDKRLKLQVVTGMERLETCIFINTRIGFIGYFPPDRNAAGACTIDPSREKFLFTVISKKGNNYYYLNNNKNGQIEHWVTTFNSDFYTDPKAVYSGNTPLRKLEETKSFFGSGISRRIDAQAYEFAEGQQKYFIYSNNYPQQILFHPQKYLGNFKIGYQQAAHGLCIIMEVRDEQTVTKILSIEDVNVCFDPTLFKEFEDEYFTKIQDKIENERAKLQREEAAGNMGPCILEKSSLLRYKMESLNRQEVNLSKAVIGNTLQNDPIAKAMALSLYSFEDQMQILRFNQELKICQAQDRLSKATSSEGITFYNNKLSCLRSGLAQLSMNMSEIQRINSEYADNPARQWAEKSKIMMRNFNACEN